MLFTYVKLSPQVNSFYDMRSGISLPNKSSVALLGEPQMNDRVLLAITHGILVQITKNEYDLIYSPGLNGTSNATISTNVDLTTFERAAVFNDVVGPIDSPPNGATTGGNLYLIGNNPLLEWKGKNGLIAQWLNGKWSYSQPEDSSIASLKLYPGVFYYYSGTYPLGSWRKYPGDSVNIPTINDINRQ